MLRGRRVRHDLEGIQIGNELDFADLPSQNLQEGRSPIFGVSVHDATGLTVADRPTAPFPLPLRASAQAAAGQPKHAQRVWMFVMQSLELRVKMSQFFIRRHNPPRNHTGPGL